MRISISLFMLIFFFNNYGYSFEIIKRKAYKVYDSSKVEIAKKVYYFEITEKLLKAVNIYYFSKDKYFIVTHIGDMEKFKECIRIKKAEFSPPGDQFYENIIKMKYFPPDDCYNFLERSYNILLKSEKGKFELDIKFKNKKMVSYDNYGNKLENLELLNYLISLDENFKILIGIMSSESNKTFFADFLNIIKKNKVKKAISLKKYEIKEDQFGCIELENIIGLKCSI